MKPFLPEGVPWQAPALQPPTFIAAITSLRKLTGSGFSVLETFTGTKVVVAPVVTFSLVAPFLSAITMLAPSIFAISGCSMVNREKGVRSRISPPAYLPVTTTCVKLRLLLKLIKAG